MGRPHLILDEPTNGLEPRAPREVQDRSRRSSVEGKTIVAAFICLEIAAHTSLFQDICESIFTGRDRLPGWPFSPSRQHQSSRSSSSAV
jgi:hypothetical protein